MSLIDPKSLPALLRASATTYATKPCIITPEQTLTFSDFFAAVVDLAGSLRKRFGIQDGDRVAVLDVNTVEHFRAVCAIGMLGAIAVPLNYRLRVPELRYQLVDSGAVLLLAGERYTQTVEVLANDDELINRGLRFTKLANSARESVVDFGFSDGPASSAPFAICYTSGTTGSPKGAVISHETCYLRALALQAELRLHSSDVMHVPTPLFHISHLNLSLMALMRGMTQLMLPQFEPEESLRHIHEAGVTFLFAVPTMLAMLLDSRQFRVSGLDSVRLIMYTGAAMPRRLLEEVRSRYSRELIQFLGQTEDLPQTALTPEDHKEAARGSSRLSSIGRPCMGVELEIRKEDGSAAAIGEVGEICTRSGTGMLGYWGLEDRTAETLRDGWLHTGDQGYRDEDGYLYLAGRKSQMVIRGGENVYPAEVEQVLDDFPAVKESVVVGLPDPKWGEIVAAAVVTDFPEIDREELRRFCKERLATYKCPERFLVVVDLPRNATGKILRQEVVKSFNES